MNRAIALCAAAGALSSAAVAGLSPQFFNLGESVEPWAVSDNGVVAALSPGHGGYVTWTQGGGFHAIGGVLPEAYGGIPSISADGMRVGGTNINPDNGRGEMAYFDYNTGVWNNLGGIGGFSDFSTSSGWGISGDGQHVVGLGWVDGGTAHATRWSQGTGTVDMGSTTPGSSSRANRVDHDGSMVVGWQDNDNGRQGAVWNNGVQSLIFDTDGVPMSEALGVSADGQWVTGIAYGDTRAWRYNTGTATHEYLAPVAGDFFFPAAFGNDISDDGSTIVGAVRDFGPPIFGTGVVWRDGHGVQTLADYFTGSGVAYEPGFLFSVPLMLSGDGLTFGGLGLSPSSGVVGWVVTVPGASSGVLLGLSALVGLRRRR